MSTATEGKTRDRIIAAALELFYYQGFSGTTIRQIAKKADVNQALISYYFGGKKGLLEALMVRFYEGYFQSIDPVTRETAAVHAIDHLIQMMQTAFEYLFEHYKMTRFIYRELTMDSMLIREVMTTYLSKEKYYYASIVEGVREESECIIGEKAQGGQTQLDLFDHLDELNQSDPLDIEMMVLQILHILYMPFLQPQAIREVYYIEPLSGEFKERYFAHLQQWVQTFLRAKL